MTLNTFDCIYYVTSPCWDIMWLYKGNEKTAGKNVSSRGKISKNVLIKKQSSEQYSVLRQRRKKREDVYCSLFTHPLVLEGGLLKSRKQWGPRNAGDAFGAGAVMLLYTLVLTQENALPS